MAERLHNLRFSSSEASHLVSSSPHGLKDMIHILKDSKVDWYELGVQLKIPNCVLQKINRENPGNESRKLTELLHYCEQIGEVSWEKIVEALQRIGGYEKIIINIQTNYLIHDSTPLQIAAFPKVATDTDIHTVLELPVVPPEGSSNKPVKATATNLPEDLALAKPLQHCNNAESILDSYGSYLNKKYMQVQDTTASSKWLLSPIQKSFSLALIKKERVYLGAIDDEFVRQSIHGQTDDILCAKSPISLENIFKNIEGERKVILLNGALCAGKTTLTIHIIQEWSKGELFQDFKLVILVQLCDPSVQHAKSLADLIPSQNKEMAQQVAGAIEGINGKGIFWVMDGWDQLPLHLQENSILRDIIIPSADSPITLSSVIVTSRPISSGALNEFASRRIELLCFTSQEQRLYLTTCLRGDTKAVDALLEILSNNPAIEGSCFLPLTASVVAYLYIHDSNLPATMYGMFSTWVVKLLSLNNWIKTGETQEFTWLENIIPPDLQDTFVQVCKIAFHGLTGNKRAFSSRDTAVEDATVLTEFCKTGLLRATLSLISDSNTVYYTFVHPAVQELLAAIYISIIPANKQIPMFSNFFEDPRFVNVMCYYARITRLNTERTFLSRIPHRLRPISASVSDVVKKIIKKLKNNISYSNPKHSLVTILKCLSEARDPALCQMVARQLDNKLNLCNTSLNSTECFAVGYFLSTISLTSCSAGGFTAQMWNCSLGDAGIKSLVCSLKRHTSIDSYATKTTKKSYLNLELNGCEIYEQGASQIADLLSSTNIVATLSLYVNPIGDGLLCVFEALKQNTTLKSLDVSFCGMTDTGIVMLANALNTNNTLDALHIFGNDAVTEHGLKYFTEVLSRSSGLTILWLSSHFQVYDVQRTINKERHRNGLTDIEVYGV